MAVTALDHVNIRTSKLEETIRFYVEGLGLPLGKMPVDLKTGRESAVRGARVCDRDGNAIVHFIYHEGQDTAPADATVDHFALACTDREAYAARLSQHGYPFEIVDYPDYGRRLLMVRDPNGVMVHLSFLAGDEGGRT